LKTPLGLLRGWVRGLARQELEAYIVSGKEDTAKEVNRLVRELARSVDFLSEGEAKGTIGKDMILLDHVFSQPSRIGGYIDATGFKDWDGCRVMVKVGVGGREELTPLYNQEYSGLMEDCIALDEQPVRGRVQVVYQQTAGKPVRIWYTFYGSK